MATTTTWSVTEMTRIEADGGVVKAYWNLSAVADDDTTVNQYDKNIFTYDASASDYIAYDDLTEADVLGWIWEANKEGEETAAEYKARIEADRVAYAEQEKEEKSVRLNGVPW